MLNFMTFMSYQYYNYTTKIIQSLPKTKIILVSESIKIFSSLVSISSTDYVR